MSLPTRHLFFLACRWLAVATTLFGSTGSVCFGQENERYTSDEPSSTEAITTRDDQRRFSFKAVDMEIKQALALFAEANELNIVPDHDISGYLTVSFNNLRLENAMDALLDAHGYYFSRKGNLIRVKNFQTRIFNIDYINTVRTGTGSNDIQFSSGNGQAEQGSTMRVSADSKIDFWQSINDQLAGIVSEDGSYTINSLAGVVSVTERYTKMEQIAALLESVSESVVRQVELEVEIYEVSLSDSQQLGIDWSVVSNRLAAEFNGQLIIPSSTIGSGFEGNTLVINHHPDSNNFIIEALQQQGDLRVLSKPKLRTLNNQPAVIRVGQDIPIFRQTVTQSPGNPPILTTQEEIENVTIGTILSITPQISASGMITLDVSPAVSRLIRNEVSAVTGASAPVLDIRQASSIVRVRDGSTVVLGGLVQTQTNKTVRKVPFIGDIPLLGKVFQGYRDTSVNNELVVILRPSITSE